MRKRIISVPVRQSIYGQGKAGNAKQKRNKNKKQKKKGRNCKKKKEIERRDDGGGLSRPTIWPGAFNIGQGPASALRAISHELHASLLAVSFSFLGSSFKHLSVYSKFIFFFLLLLTEELKIYNER